MTDATLGASGLWLGTRTGAGGTATLAESFFFWPQPMAPSTTGHSHKQYVFSLGNNGILLEDRPTDCQRVFLKPVLLELMNYRARCYHLA